jgi:hypothetical protein
MTSRTASNDKYSDYMLSPVFTASTGRALDNLDKKTATVTKVAANSDGAVMIPSLTRDRGRTQISPRVFQAVPDLRRGAFHDNLPIILSDIGGVDDVDLSEVDFERFIPLLDSVKAHLDDYRPDLMSSGMDTRQ